ncbi:unnamed protein product, partial [Timema podura]|nr:unnamed protein product [Timema podura]
MASEQVLKNLCSSLESTKVTERKKSMNELSSLLHEQDTLLLLNRNSQTNLAENITWNKLFHLAHNLAVKEAEKIKLDEQKRESYSETTKNNWVTTKSGCGTFVTHIVNKANR